MKVRNLLVLITMLFFITSLILGTALAGDENDPEVEDDTGEINEPGREFRDIAAAWFSETNETIKITMKLAGPPPSLYDFAQGIDTTTFDYEVYFDVEGIGYAVSVGIQYAFVAGTIYTFDVPWAWELRKVTYATHTDIILSESVMFNFDGDDNGDGGYEPEYVELKWEVHKEAIGIGLELEGRGQELVNTWAAVWNADENSANSQRDPSTQAWDYAHTHHSNPGKNYRITGFGGVDYNIELSADIDEKLTYGGTPVEFLVRAYNNGTDSFVVNFFPGSYPESWSVNLSENRITIARGTTRPIMVTVTPPKDVENGTVLVLLIEGDIQMIDGNDTIPIQPPLTLRTIALTPLDEPDGGGWLEDFVDMLKENLAIIAGVIAVMVVAIIVLAVLIKR